MVPDDIYSTDHPRHFQAAPGKPAIPTGRRRPCARLSKSNAVRKSTALSQAALACPDAARIMYTDGSATSKCRRAIASGAYQAQQQLSLRKNLWARGAT